MKSPQVRQINEYEDAILVADRSRRVRHVAIAAESWS
jgi:hypothetical protein